MNFEKMWFELRNHLIKTYKKEITPTEALTLMNDMEILEIRIIDNARKKYGGDETNNPRPTT